MLNGQMTGQEAIHVTIPPSYAECKSASQVCVVCPISIPMNGVVVVGHCGRGPSSYSLYRYYHQEALGYYNIGTLYTRIIIYLFSRQKFPVVQLFR